MTKRVAHILMVAAVWAMLGACGDTEFRYSNYHCNLTLDNAIHQDATLASAMDSNAPGTFCAIGCKMEAVPSISRSAIAAEPLRRASSRLSTTVWRASSIWVLTARSSWAMAIWITLPPSTLTMVSAQLLQS